MTDRCAVNPGEEQRVEGKHLLIIGGGSAAFAAAITAAELRARATMVNHRLPTGGTCVNVGCVPSKTLIRAAEVLHRATRHAFDGVDTHGRVRDFGAIVRQKRTLVEELRRAKYLDVIGGLEGIRLLEGQARIVAPGAISVDGRQVEGDAILIASGARPAMPPVPGLAESGYLTNETAYELEELPASILVLGGRFVALETAQMFARFGSRVTLLQRSARILPTEAPDLTDALTGFLRQEGMGVVTGVTVQQVERRDGQVVVQAVVDGHRREYSAHHLMVATGRQPNTQGLGLEALGVATDGRGFVRASDTLETSVPGIYAAGDVLGEEMFVYTAAYEGKLAAENALAGACRKRDYTGLPWVLFTDPQVAGVGLDEIEAKERGIPVDVTRLPLSHVPRALAARDTRGFIKLIRDPSTDRLLGARILAPEGSELLMELSLAIRHRIPVSELASLLHPYLTLSEGVKLAALTFGKDVAKLSCCAT